MFAVRNPRHRNAISEFFADLSKKVMSLALATPERWASQVTRMRAAGVLKENEKEVSYEQLKEFFERGEFDVNVSRGYRISLEMGAIEPVLKTMENREWTLLIAGPQTGGYITTDHPVCVTNGDGVPPSFQNPIGHGTTGSTLIIPICKDLLAIGTFTGLRSVVHATNLQVAMLNSMVVQFAERQIYAADDQFRIISTKGRKPISGAAFAQFIAEINTGT
jgi:hypothetical protein